MKRRDQVALILAVATAACGQTRQVDFDQEIRPILQGRCTVCHGGIKREAGLSLLSGAEALQPTANGNLAIVPGDPSASEIVRRLRHPDPRKRMPPEGSPLTAHEIERIEAWIEAGAHWPTHWAYVPPVRPQPPDVRKSEWVRSDIDRFILARMEAAGLEPSPPADCATLVRRLYLDLVGLPPPVEEVEAYCSRPDEEAYRELVDRLLDTPHFGERWASMWLDLARYADTKGYEKDPHRTIWKYRDWVMDAFNRDLPFDQFTIEQLAGDLLPGASESQRIATAFHRNTMTNTEGGTSDEEFRIAAVIDRVNTTMEVWQATTIQCVQCHNHPYEPIRHEEYYRLFALFNNTADSDLADEAPVLHSFRDEERRRSAEPILEEIRGLEQELEAAAEEAWLQRELAEWVEIARRQLMSSEGRDLFGLKEIPEESEIEEIIKEDEQDRDPNERMRLTRYFVSVVPRLKPLRERLAAARKRLSELDPIVTPVMQELPDHHARITRVFERGNWLLPRAPVQPGVPDVLGRLPEGGKADRLTFARWLVAPENPLTVRVTVNRFWHQIFGRGLVPTLEDLGSRGDRPSHPELLDWLAVRFSRDLGWSVKSLLREIVLSATYRQSSAVEPTLLERDPYNELYARSPRYRLSAEQIRDQALAVGGLLSKRMYGPSVMPPQPEGVWNSPYGEADRWITSTGEDRYRRGVYTYWKRTSPYPSMVTFDHPSRETAVSRRIRSSTALQALVTLNDPVFVEAAAGLARRMLDRNGGSGEKVAWGYRVALSREPEQAVTRELEELFLEARRYFEAHPEQIQSLSRTIESRIEGPDHAALTVVANAIMNLDDFLTRN
ncbi:MAG: hypothetical protein Kow001_12370 [Acidobacteriota bacterium]